MAFIDSNPVRSGMVAQAADYPWSSAAHWLGLRHDRMLSPHAAYWALGNTPFAREAAYAVDAPRGSITASGALAGGVLRSSGWALGSPEFVQGLQQQTPRRITKSEPGRPRKTPSKTEYFLCMPFLVHFQYVPNKYKHQYGDLLIGI